MDLTLWFMAGFTGLVAVFTYLLWRATRDYAEVTKKLLEQSQAASKRSRTALLIDVIDRTIQSITQPLTDGRIDEFAGSFTGKLAIIGRIDEKAAKEIVQALKCWCSETTGNIKKKCTKFLNKYEEVSKNGVDFL